MSTLHMPHPKSVPNQPHHTSLLTSCSPFIIIWGVCLFICLFACFLNSLGLTNITFIHVGMGSFSEARTTFQRPHVGENDFLSFGSSIAHSYSPRGEYLRARPLYLIEFLTGLDLCQSWVVVITSVSAEVVL